MIYMVTSGEYDGYMIDALIEGPDVDLHSLYREFNSKYRKRNTDTLSKQLEEDGVDILEDCRFTRYQLFCCWLFSKKRFKQVEHIEKHLGR